MQDANEINVKVANMDSFEFAQFVLVYNYVNSASLDADYREQTMQAMLSDRQLLLDAFNYYTYGEFV